MDVVFLTLVAWLCVDRQHAGLKEQQMEREYLESSMSPEMGDEHSPDIDHDADYPEEHEPHAAHPIAFS